MTVQRVEPETERNEGTGPSTAGPSLVAVITADVIHSRRAVDRAALQRHLAEGLARFNRSEREELLVPFTLSRGDELQGVLLDPTRVLRLARHLRFHLWPTPLRVGIGIGTVSTPVSTESSWLMDGPAFHAARAALEAGTHRGKPQLAFRSGDPEMDEVLNAICGLVDALQSRWTTAQWTAIDAYERLSTFERAGRVLGVSLQNVEKRCSAARWSAVRQAEEFSERYLRRRMPMR